VGHKLFGGVEDISGVEGWRRWRRFRTPNNRGKGGKEGRRGGERVEFSLVQQIRMDFGGALKSGASGDKWVWVEGRLKH
jgi:hypothetical protein